MEQSVVERFQMMRVKPSQRDVAERWEDVVLHVAAVAVVGGGPEHDGVTVS